MSAPKPEKNKSLESWIWDAACSIRGAKDAPNGEERHRLPGRAARRVSAEARIKYKDYILPLIFTKRLGLKDVEADIIDKSYEPSGARQTARQDSPKGERGGANQNLFYNTTAPGIVLFLNKAKPKARQGKVFLVNASQVFEKGDPKNFIPEPGIQRIADVLIGWQEEEKLSRIVELAELKKNDYNISPSRYIHTSDAETYRPIAEIVEELKVIEAEARETDKALAIILKQLGI